MDIKQSGGHNETYYINLSYNKILTVIIMFSWRLLVFSLHDILQPARSSVHSDGASLSHWTLVSVSLLVGAGDGVARFLVQLEC